MGDAILRSTFCAGLRYTGRRYSSLSFCACAETVSVTSAAGVAKKGCPFNLAAAALWKCKGTLVRFPHQLLDLTYAPTSPPPCWRPDHSPKGDAALRQLPALFLGTAAAQVLGGPRWGAWCAMAPLERQVRRVEGGAEPTRARMC